MKWIFNSTNMSRPRRWMQNGVAAFGRKPDNLISRRNAAVCRHAATVRLGFEFRLNNMQIYWQISPEFTEKPLFTAQ
jgi:hypothetical protein